VKYVLVILAIAFGTISIAHAQAPAPAPAPTAEPAAPTAPTITRTLVTPTGVPGVSTPATDVDTGSGSGMALLFWTFAAVAVFGSIFVITRRNLIAAVMGMVATFFGLAVLYMMLYASFLAIIQMLVYAGAIMVLFVFVIMVLNKPEDEPWGMVGVPGKVLAGVAMLYLLARVVMLLWGVSPPDAKKAADAPPPIAVTWHEKASGPDDPRPVDPQNGSVVVTEKYDFGSTAAVG
jgi:NADH:ubiquinone oxidoreductase subunit 6 (subunit J)